MKHFLSLPLAFAYSIACIPSGGLALGQDDAQPTTQLSPEFRSIVEAALRLRNVEFTVDSHTAKVKTKKGFVYLPLQDLEKSCTSTPMESCLALSIAFFSGALSENPVIGPLGTLLKHKVQLDPFDPRLPLLKYHQLQEDEIAGWKQLPESRILQTSKIGQRQELDALLANKMEYDSDNQTNFTDIKPHEVDVTITALVNLYQSSSNDLRRYARSRISSDQGWALVTFAKRVAIRARQTGNKSLVADGLAALAIDNLAQGDVRDTLVAIGLLYHIARGLNIDTIQLFNRAAAISGPAMSAVFSDFLMRDDLDRVLVNMGWREVIGPNGTSYVWDIN